MDSRLREATEAGLPNIDETIIPNFLSLTSEGGRQLLKLGMKGAWPCCA